MNNIYAKTVHKECTVPRTNYTQLHQLGVWGSAESFCFNSIFIDKKAHL